ncbi:MAG: hypothetical protein OEZ23_01650 [Gammaproteobacteria bacterium]|nr:hypothetical protein [Gammaproteobacteria bacterium]
MGGDSASKPADLLPHGQSMVLIDRIVRWDSDSICCQTDSHKRTSNPLHRNNSLSAANLIEYGAQAMALHEVLARKKDTDGIYRPISGMVSALKNVMIARVNMDSIAESLEIKASKEFVSLSGAIYVFEVLVGDRILAEGRITVNHQKV